LVLVLALFVSIVAAIGVFDPITLNYKKIVSFPVQNGNFNQEWVVSDKESNVKLFLGLRHQYNEELRQRFVAVTDPKSSEYAKYLSLDQIEELFSVEDDGFTAVMSWLSDHGITEENSEVKVSQPRDLIRITCSIEKASSLLGVSFKVYQHRSREGLIVARADDTQEIVIPDSVSGVIELISGVFGFPKLNKVQFTSFADVSKAVTPSVVYAQYQVPTNMMSTNTENRQAVAEFQGEFFSPSDLQTFFGKFMPSLKGQIVKQVVGTNIPSEPGLEPNLDVQYIMSTGPGVNMTVYNINEPSSIYTDFLEWVWDIGNDTQAPWVHSVSYGAYGGKYPSGPVHQLDNEYIKLALRGITILFASGDNGVGCSVSCQKFEPDFPSSPYVTMVGSTQLDAGATVETGASFSAGGFSNTWTMPSWQESAVEAYLSSGVSLPASHYYNASGRGYPDLSSLGVNVQIVQKGKVVAVDGTSCSSPIVAGLISMLNEIRLNADKPTLGFLNPLLYQWAASNPNAFHDITSGKNAQGCCPGFDAYAGWDPVTGLGSPDFAVWSQLVTDMD